MVVSTAVSTMEYSHSHAIGTSYSHQHSYKFTEPQPLIKNNSTFNYSITHMYNFRAFITDQSAIAPFTFFTPGADDDRILMRVKMSRF